MAKKMKAAVKTAAGDFEVKDVPMPEITEPNFVLARVKAAGVCGSDLHFWKVPTPKESEFGMWAGEEAIMGHELAGDVVAVGDDVTNVKPGDRVGIESVVSCGRCYWCRVGQYHLCPDLGKIRSSTLARAFGEYVAGPSDKFYPLPDHVGYAESAIMDVYGTSVHAINRTGVRMDQTVVIIGAGPIGLSLLDLVNVAGAKGIITDILDFPLEAAEKTFGAYETINSAKEDPVEKVMELTDGRGADVVCECVGGKVAAITLPQAVSLVRRKGKVALIGGLRRDLPAMELDWPKIQWGEVDIVPVSGFYFWGNDPEFQIVSDLLADGKLHATEMITHRFPLEKINEAFETAANKEKTKSI
ncbi:MAG: alcohol dehydrogenase catalytic domain-containing protein, partial [Candidatus Bathyarchaeota archaeon]